MSEAPPNSADSKSTAQATPTSAADETSAKLAKLEEQLRSEQQKYVYLYADFDNYKKRATREREELIKFGFEKAATDILQVADNLQRAVDHIPETTDKNLRSGIQMVLEQLKQTLQRHGVEAIACSGKAFDPHFHEAVGQIPSESPAGTVVHEQQKGYVLHGRLLRPARVLVSTGVPPNGSSANA